jgi:hypothetical protein
VPRKKNEFDFRNEQKVRERRKNAPELLDENGDAGPSAQAQCPFRSTADRQTTTHMINGDKPSKE